MRYADVRSTLLDLILLPLYLLARSFQLVLLPTPEVWNFGLDVAYPYSWPTMPVCLLFTSSVT